MPVRRHRPPATWTSRYLKPAPVARFVLFDHTRITDEKASTSQNRKRVRKIPGKGDTEGAPA